MNYASTFQRRRKLTELRMSSDSMSDRRRRWGRRSRFVSYINYAILAAVVLLSSSTPTTEAKNTPLSPLSSIPTHHGINANVHFSGGGGAVARLRHHRRRRKYSGRNIASSSSFSEPKSSDGSVSLNAVTPVVSSTYLSRGEQPSGVVKVEKIAGSTQQRTRGASVARDDLTVTAIVCMSFLAIQFGIQPILVRKYTPQTIVRSSVVLVQEVVKFGIAGTVYFSGTKKETRNRDLTGWSVKTWIAMAGLPAFLYTIQNIASLMAYQNLEGLTFNVLNQTKILSAALCCYFVMGKKQSKMQVISLCLLCLSTLVIERVVHPNSLLHLISVFGGGKINGATTNLVQAVKNAFVSLGDVGGRRFTHGIVPIMVASMISGMAGALTQLNLQGGGSREPLWAKSKKVESTSPPSERPPRNAYLFSMEMNVASVILLVGSLFCSADGRNVVRSRTFFSGWTPHTFIPVVTNSIGGILVGLVTKHAGSVRKGFALIFGLLLSGILQAGSSGIRSEQIVGGMLAAFCLWMHMAHPYVSGTVPSRKE